MKLVSNCPDYRTPLTLVFIPILFLLICAESEKGLESVQQKLVIHSIRIRINSSKSATNPRNPPVQKLSKVENVTENVRVLEEVSQIALDRRLKSVCVQAGLWAIFQSHNFSRIAAVLYASSLPDDQACTNDKLNASAYAQYKSVRHIGNPDLLSPGLSLYSGKFFSGDELYFDGSFLNLPEPTNFSSYGFTGRENWTLFTSRNYAGVATCLLTYKRDPGDKYDSVVYNKDIRISVGSLRRGCFGSRSGNGTRNILIMPSGERRTNPDVVGSDESSSSPSPSPSLALLSPDSGTEVFLTDGTLRLPRPITFEALPRLSGNSSWTLFPGFEFVGRSRCLFGDLGLEEELVVEDPKNVLEEAGGAEVLLVGSVKRGCFRSAAASRTPRLLLTPSNVEEEVKVLEGNPGNAIFFISFLIGLAFLLILILLLISTILYFYVWNRRNRLTKQGPKPPPGTLGRRVRTN